MAGRSIQLNLVQGFGLAQRAARSGVYGLGGKRALDLVLLGLFAPLWMPLLCLLWLISWLEAGQGLYVDLRVGRDGRVFRCWKIRTMRRDLPRGCAAYKQINDPRVTRIGGLLRRSSLDELPQLLCVLKGEMSLVGPRPIPASELDHYGTQQRRYLALRPGLTGLWQISGRNALPYSERVALDVRYANKFSTTLDLQILCATCREVWRMSGR